MTRTFGRRASAGAASPVAPVPVDPRIAALAASVRSEDPARTELRAYFAERRAAIGPWRWAARSLFVAPTAASWLLGVHGLWLAPISLASLVGPVLVKRARLRWAAEIETRARQASRCDQEA